MAWEAEQEEKWELVDGYAVPRSERWDFDAATGMAGARRSHNRVVANLIRHLGNRLAGTPCEALPSDIKTRSPTGSGRYPDVTVECGQTDLESLTSEPRLVFEVLSRSNTLKQQLKLLDDYQAVLTMEQIVFLEQDRPAALSWTRSGQAWTREELEGLGAELDLRSLGFVLSFAEVYEGFPFAAAQTA
jgi:Uma2 family endonuclease